MPRPWMILIKLSRRPFQPKTARPCGALQSQATSKRSDLSKRSNISQARADRCYSYPLAGCHFTVRRVGKARSKSHNVLHGHLRLQVRVLSHVSFHFVYLKLMQNWGKFSHLSVENHRNHQQHARTSRWPSFSANPGMRSPILSSRLSLPCHLKLYCLDFPCEMQNKRFCIFLVGKFTK